MKLGVRTTGNNEDVNSMNCIVWLLIAKSQSDFSTDKDIKVVNFTVLTEQTLNHTGKMLVFFPPTFSIKHNTQATATERRSERAKERKKVYFFPFWLSEVKNCRTKN